MRLSVSVRIAEGFLSKEVPILSLEEVAKIASSARYDAICMRASQLGVQSSEQQVQAAAELLGRHGLGVSMVTGDFDTVSPARRIPCSFCNSDAPFFYGAFLAPRLHERLSVGLAFVYCPVSPGRQPLVTLLCSSASLSPWGGCRAARPALRSPQTASA